MDSIATQTRSAVAALDGLLRRHPRTLTGGVVALLLGSAVTAFGIAPLAPDAAELPRRLVSETPAAALDVPAQLEALGTHATALYRSDLTRSADTVDSLLQRLGVDDPEAAAFLRRDPTAHKLLDGRAGKMVQALAEGGRLLQLIARYPHADEASARTHFTRLTVERRTQPDGASAWQSNSESVPLKSEARMASGTIESSLFAAADEARLPDHVTVQLAELFGAEIDFRRELRRGDRFTVLYESRTADGEPVAWGGGAGRVLAAQFVNAGKAYDAVWFEFAREDGVASKGSYFDLQGKSLARMFLGSPLAFSRVTSGFAMRLHPVLNTWRQHAGVDYAAPTGTPVRAMGDGIVDFAGRQNGYGNVVILRHAGERETRYAHLSRIAVRQGTRVEQGQNIGAVGATGWATGPHLHFEFRVRGAVRDPLTIARASEAVNLPATAKSRFESVATSARQWFAHGAIDASVAEAAAARFE
ncbi:M23 family metallopeptidase [Methylibium sp.]|uniref:M23 family metallopeptidase n=1 Tax=Methylibium sp. TaxID=2067992 RepID=UPI0039C9EF6B